MTGVQTCALPISLEKSCQFTEGTNYKSWLYSIMYSIFINSVKRYAKFNQVADTFVRKTPPRKDADKESFAKIEDAIKNLKPQFSEVATLFFLKEYSYAEIAKKIDCPIGTVMSRVYRARKNLQEELYEFRMESKRLARC